MIPDSTKKNFPNFGIRIALHGTKFALRRGTFSRGIVYVVEILCIRRIRKVIVIS